MDFDDIRDSAWAESPMAEAEAELGIAPGELAGTFPPGFVDATGERGVLHRHEDGREHRHFSAGFTIGRQVIPDRDGTEQHIHSVMGVQPGDVQNNSGPLAYLVIDGRLIEPHSCQNEFGGVAASDMCIICYPQPDQLVCVQCGCDVWIDDNGVAFHWDSGNGDVDYDLDRDHTAVPDNDEYGIFATGE